MSLKLKIQIKGITKPPVWRELLIPDSFSFRQLHSAIQLAFDWHTAHLYEFQEQSFGRGWCIGEPNGEDEVSSKPITPAATVNVRRFIEENGIDKFVYVYNLCESWVHQISVEALTNDKIKLPRCLAGKGTPPPEDCGVASDYENLKRSLMKDAPDTGELERLKWYRMYDEETNKPFDINFCNIEQINNDLRHLKSFAKELDALYDRTREKEYDAAYDNMIALSSEWNSAHSDDERNKIADKLAEECEKLMSCIFRTDWMVNKMLNRTGKFPADIKPKMKHSRAS